MRPVSTEFRCSFLHPPNAVILGMKPGDGRLVDQATGAGYLFLITDDQGKPVEDTYQQRAKHIWTLARDMDEFSRDNARQFLEKELALFANNPWAHLDKWSYRDEEEKVAGRSRILSWAMNAVTRAGPENLLLPYHAYCRLDASWFAEARSVAKLLLPRDPSHPLSDRSRLEIYEESRFINDRDARRELCPLFRAKDPEVKSISGASGVVPAALTFPSSMRWSKNTARSAMSSSGRSLRIPPPEFAHISRTGGFRIASFRTLKRLQTL